METTITINNALLISFADRSSSGFKPVYEQDEEGNDIELTEEELNEQKVAFAKVKLVGEVLAKFLRPAEVEIRKAKLAEVAAEVEAIKEQASQGVTAE